MQQRAKTSNNNSSSSQAKTGDNSSNNGHQQQHHPGQSRRRPRPTTNTGGITAISSFGGGGGGRKRSIPNSTNAGHNNSNNHAGNTSHKIPIKSSITIFAFLLFAVSILVLEWNINILVVTNHHHEQQQQSQNQRSGDVTITTDQRSSSPTKQLQQQKQKKQEEAQPQQQKQKKRHHLHHHDHPHQVDDQEDHYEQRHQEDQDPHRNQNDKISHMLEGVSKPPKTTTTTTTAAAATTSQETRAKKVVDIIADKNKNNKVTYLYDSSPPDLTSANNNSNEGFYPDWIINYIKWHQEIRQKYPNMELFTNPNAPNILIRTCLGMCGGLHDRLGQLPWDLYLANQTQRILLLSWQRPRSIEHFLIPSHPTIFNWSIPYEAHFGFDDMKYVRDDIKELFYGYEEANPTNEFWNIHLDLALQRASPNNKTGIYSNEKLLRHRILGHLGKDVLEQRLRKHYDDAGITNYPQRHVQLFDTPIFGKIFFELFFQPSQSIEKVFTNVMKKLQLQPNEYTAVHCRVRHPKNFQKGQLTLGKNPNYPADKTGLPWDKSSTKLFAMNVATNALQCAIQTKRHQNQQQQQQQQQALHGDHETAALTDDVDLSSSSSSTTTTTSTASSSSGINTIYFMSDSNDLVRHVAEELFDPKFIAQNLNKTGTTTTSSNGSSNKNDNTNKRNNNNKKKKNKKKNDDIDDNEEEGETIMIDPNLYQQVLEITAASSSSQWNNNGTVSATTSTRRRGGGGGGGGGRIVARDVSEENAHIDRQKGRSPPAYYGTFVDLLVAMHAECVIFGIGYYAEFAAHISGTTCEGVYQKESWGQQVPKHAYTCV